ncbi:hypothetical protein Lalb_Chr17g0337891 [Lupinus albus]|uniref:Uncharacterized protein n=1 Tax=Lupinus albus TaxID=3870 RepID=A0A6A4P4Z6_LUPAL|nr:hypothetical protein Lalb_Chr17g0337891 [Lupinus albus]
MGMCIKNNFAPRGVILQNWSNDKGIHERKLGNLLLNYNNASYKTRAKSII